jgi:hypothetical protein
VNISWEAEFERLLTTVLDGSADADELRRLDALLAENPAAMNAYVSLMQVDAMLRWRAGLGKPKDEEPIIINVSEPLRGPTLGLYPWAGIPAFSYVAAAVIMALVLSVAGLWKVSRDYDRDPGVVRDGKQPARQRLDSAPVFVGRVTGLAHCQWADPKDDVVNLARVALGRRFALSAGFMEITYDTGARVILEGPATYEVESTSGGYLSLGKLTARVESRESRVESRELRVEGEVAAQEPSRLSTLDSRLFSVRTPTAVVTDLGTEFGVEVDKSGTSQAHVFQGKVELRISGDDHKDRVIPLAVNESATVESERGRAVVVVRQSHASQGRAFAHRMPQRLPIGLFNTGVGVSVGEADLHWQLAARSDDRGFKPRAAVVTGTAAQYLPNDPGRSQWISTAGELPHLPEGVTFTFRTTFELTGTEAELAVLRGGFIADNHVDAVRLNGHAAAVPQHGYGYDEDLFLRFHPLAIDKGFVAGTNVLEVDVFNGDLKSKRFYPNRVTPMALRVELQGFALHGRDAPGTTTGSAPPGGGRKEGGRK